MMNMNMMTNINMMKNKSSVQGHNNNNLYRTPSSHLKKKSLNTATFPQKICIYHYKNLITKWFTFILLKNLLVQGSQILSHKNYKVCAWTLKYENSFNYFWNIFKLNFYDHNFFKNMFLSNKGTSIVLVSLFTISFPFNQIKS